MTSVIRRDGAALGFRVKSGWAAAVLMSDPVQSPKALDSRVINLSDPAVPESRQPYHAAVGVLEEEESEVQRRVKVVRRVMAASVAELLGEYDHAGHGVRATGLVVGSETDPASIKNPHIRAHALEGQLFRTVLGAAIHSHALPTLIVVEGAAYSQAESVLDRPEDELRSALADFGRSLSGPWRADQKLAALVAWMALA
jgi:hypothetical protein